MSACTLPPELDDIILDHLHDDRSALASCALVRRSWLPAVRYHNWRDLRVACAQTDLKTLEGLLDDSPSLVHHVRNIVLAQKQGDVCQWYDLHLLRSALTVLSRFPALDSFTLDGLWFGVSKQTPLPPCDIIFPSVRRLRISSCTFDSFNDVQEFCNTFPSLTSIQFDGVWWGRWGTPQGGAVFGASPSAATLKELELGSCFSRDTVVDWIINTLPERSLETLRLPLVGAYDTRLRDLLRFAGTSLRYLELGSPSLSTVRHRVVAPGEYSPLESYLDMSENTRLRVLQLGVPTYRDPQFITLWLATVLAQVAAPALEEVRFAIHPILRGDADDAAHMLDTYDWAQVVDVLARPKFVALRKITFVSGRLSDYAKIPDAFVQLQPVLAKVVPRLFQKVLKNGVELDFRCV